MRVIHAVFKLKKWIYMYTHKCIQILAHMSTEPYCCCYAKGRPGRLLRSLAGFITLNELFNSLSTSFVFSWWIDSNNNNNNILPYSTVFKVKDWERKRVWAMLSLVTIECDNIEERQRTTLHSSIGLLHSAHLACCWNLSGALVLLFFKQIIFLNYPININCCWVWYNIILKSWLSKAVYFASCVWVSFIPLKRIASIQSLEPG